MRIKTFGPTFLIAVLASAAAAKAEDLSISTTVAFESRYMFRGVQFAETSFQPAVSLSYGGFYANAWLNLPVGDDDLVVTPGGEELDLVFGYSTELNEAVSVDIGVTYYMFPDVMSGFFDTLDEEDGAGANTLEPYVGVSFALPLSPSVYFYRDFMFDTFTLQGSASHSFPLSEKLSFDLGGVLGYVIDDDDGADYLYGHASADLSYAFSEKSSIYLGARYGGSDIDGGSVIDDSIAGTLKSSGFWWGLGFSSDF